ncbi:filamentous hemagglutinin N-terminal domain-containing protein [Scytonema sp. PCC 10023]|uniref:two-partner secretion domain-containing protein n=1 Tax=Scytonema sp. PCC 10023 TaxID=1680591 RepID=UPI0039C61BEC
MFAISTRWGCLLGITIGGAYAFWANCANAQITPDSTLPNNSSVTIQDNIRTIEGGTQAGSNLFHSFKEFSVPTGSTAFFNNAADIQNILSRVTGGSVSNIDGLIKANGTANLFMINPNGIIFGPNARLNIGGSFLGSTASSINFADGTKFSATPSPDKPLLTITAPIGLGLGTNPGEIQVRGPGHDINLEAIKKTEEPRDPVNSSVPGLELQSGKTLALVGGKVSVEGGVLKSSSGRVEIGSVASNGVVSLVPVQEGWKLDYSGTPSFGDIQFSGKSFVDTTGVGGGSIAVAGKNISLAGEALLLSETRGDRNGQEISIVGDEISVISSEINTATFSSGNAGQVKLVANKSILLENNGGAGANTQGLGKAGEITLKADSIEVRDRSGLGSKTFSEGDAGRIEVKANSLLIDNAGFGASSNGEGNAGEMNIAVGDFVVRNYAGLGVETKGAGNAGKINVTANSLRISDNSNFTSVSENTGNAGKISITANSLLIENGSGFTSAAKEGSTGQAGEINLNVAGSVVFQNFAGISNAALGEGNAGKINITANSLLISDNSGFSSGTQNTGQAGEININVAGPLVLQNYSGIDSNTYGTVNAGQITVRAESLEISNVSGISTTTTGSGNAGNLYIRAKTVNLDNDGRFRLESTGSGNAGAFEIVADIIKLDNQSLIDATTTSGNGGNLTLNVGNLLLLRRGSQISTSAGTQEAGGNGGNITINAPNGFIVAVPNENSDITANAFSGTGGKITIKATDIFGIAPLSRQEIERLRREGLNPSQLPTNDITAISQTNPSLSGTIEINTPDIDPNTRLINLPTVPVDTEVAQGCNSPNYAQSSFIITGRGGLPPNPKDILTPDAVEVDWVTLNPNTNNRKSPSVSTRTKPTPEPIVEATGWVFNAKGEVVLTADAPTTTPRNSWSPSARCRAS